MTIEHIGVADAKRRFSELAERVGRGESFVIVNRGRPVVALVPPQRVAEDEPLPPTGLAAFAGALAGEWDTIDEDMIEIVAARQQVSDRPAPELTWRNTASTLASSARRSALLRRRSSSPRRSQSRS